jgi:serine/threonine protein kinase
VADFGIAKAEVRASHTHAGVLKGKYAYMAPEQAMGRDVDARADVFSLGVCAWEMLAGRRLYFRDNEPAMIRAVTEEDAPRLDTLRPDLPRGLGDEIARALARDPAILFLDEPTASLDPAATKAIEDIVRTAAARGVKVVMSTHDLGQAKRIGGDVVLLHRGRLIEAAPAEQFFTQPRTKEARKFIAGELLV